MVIYKDTLLEKCNLKIFVIGTWKNPYRFVRRDESVYSLTVVEFMTGNFTQYGIEIFFGKGLKRMTEIRRRRPYRNKSGGGKNGYLKSRGGQGEAVTYLGMSPQQLLTNGAGLLVCLWVGYKHASYMALIHDNNTWFSSIKVMIMSKSGYLL